jgi:hypothetical protein
MGPADSGSKQVCDEENLAFDRGLDGGLHTWKKYRYGLTE